MIPTPEQRAEWRRLADKATEGPLHFQPWGGQNQNGDYAESILMDGHGETMVYGLADADGAFIAAAREAVPALLDALDAVEDERDAAQAAIRDARSHARRLIANAQRWEAPALREGTHTLLLTLDGAVTVRGGAIAALADRQRTEGERDRALARIEKVRESLAPYAARDHDDTCDGDTYCGRDVAEEALDALDGDA